MRKTTPWYERALAKSTWSDSGCLEFNGNTSRGYGYIRDSSKNKRLSRLSYERSNGEIPEGLIVRHTCDNTRCWNPEHLLVGTQSDNMKDMVSRDRGKLPCNKGSKHGNSKLTEDQVLDIRNLLFNGVKGKDIAEMYSISKPQVSMIKNGKHWKHIEKEMCHDQRNV